MFANVCWRLDHYNDRALVTSLSSIWPQGLPPYQLKALAALTQASVILGPSVQRQHCMADQSMANLVCTHKHALSPH